MSDHKAVTDYTVVKDQTAIQTTQLCQIEQLCQITAMSGGISHSLVRSQMYRLSCHTVVCGHSCVRCQITQLCQITAVSGARSHNCVRSQLCQVSDHKVISKAGYKVFTAWSCSCLAQSLKDPQRMIE